MLNEWVVDLETSIVSHRDGWKFQFSPDVNEADAFDDKCIWQPEPFRLEHMHDVARRAREAGEAYAEARRARH